MPSIFKVKQAAVFAADGITTAFKVGDEISSTHPMFGALNPKHLQHVRDDPDPAPAQMRNKPVIIKPEPEPVKEYLPPDPEPEPAPEPTPAKVLYQKATKPKPKKGR